MKASTIGSMPLTHHPVRLFRLSCGCLRGYPMMPAGVQHVVLCITCRAEVLTVCVYPERRCGTLRWTLVAGSRTRVSCTWDASHLLPGWHYDTMADAYFFTAVPRLTKRREGKTGRA